VVKSGAEIEPPPPPAYGSDTYWADAEEKARAKAREEAEQKRIAEEWNLSLGSVTPPGVWNLRAKALAREYKLDAADTARLFAVLNAAIFDAMVACWHAKYKWWTERPVTVIRAERDATFTPHLVTPGFPSYVSGHATVSGAAAEVLSAFFPDEAAKVQALAEEAAMSRLYGGIHFRSDNEQGLALGRAVGARAAAYARQPEAAQSAASTR
jgi:membrane-associated phospholipid phosphatase